MIDNAKIQKETGTEFKDETKKRLLIRAFSEPDFDLITALGLLLFHKDSIECFTLVLIQFIRYFYSINY